MEGLVSLSSPHSGDIAGAYAGRRVLVTGDTGFKGSWLCTWLAELGAEVTGYALPPPTIPSMYESTGAARRWRHIDGDVRDTRRARGAMREARPDFVFHLAAQALVRDSYSDPIATLETNVLGTAQVLDAVRHEVSGQCNVVVVTSDKCYENREWAYAYREDDPIGGADVYSASKGAAEVIVASWRRSFFPIERLAEHGVAIATARAGNVIGGGDWARDRIVPDAMRALMQRVPIMVRNPDSVRPWQHVLDALNGYLLLGARLSATQHGGSLCEAWNFGPRVEDARPVAQLVSSIVEAWGPGKWIAEPHDASAPREARLLRLATEKAHARLGWRPRWTFEDAVERTVAWYRAFADGFEPEGLHALSVEQIRAFQET